MENINKMVQIALKMINDAILSFVNEDIELAKKTILLDDEVDHIYAMIISDLIHFDKNTEYAIPYIIYTTLVAKYIERIADHASNIANGLVILLKVLYLKITDIKMSVIIFVIEYILYIIIHLS